MVKTTATAIVLTAMAYLKANLNSVETATLAPGLVAKVTVKKEDDATDPKEMDLGDKVVTNIIKEDVKSSVKNTRVVDTMVEKKKVASEAKADMVVKVGINTARLKARDMEKNTKGVGTTVKKKAGTALKAGTQAVDTVWPVNPEVEPRMVAGNTVKAMPPRTISPARCSRPNSTASNTGIPPPMTASTRKPSIT